MFQMSGTKGSRGKMGVCTVPPRQRGTREIGERTLRESYGRRRRQTMGCAGWHRRGARRLATTAWEYRADRSSPLAGWGKTPWPVCAARRFVVSLAHQEELGGVFLGQRLTWRRKP